MKPTEKEIMEAAARLTCLGMYPTNPAAHKETMRLLQRMVPTKRDLDWLIDAMIDRVGEWRGTAQLRALLSTHCKPADGIEGPTCQISGFTPADSETAHLDEMEQLKLEAKKDNMAGIIRRLN